MINYGVSMENKFIEIERKRKKLLALNIIFGFCDIASGILFATLYFYGMSESFNFPLLIVFFVLMWVFIILGLFCYKYINKHRKKYVSFYKENFVASVVENLYDNVVYQAAKRISTSVIEAANMVKIGNTVNGDDYISAQYRDIDFVHCDLHIQNLAHKNIRTNKNTYFKGKWMYFDFHKDFSKYVIIRENTEMFEKTSHSCDNGEKIMFESVDFNDEFDVYATDQHTAFYLLTPHFIESLRKLRDKTNGQLILGFIDGKLHIAINSGKNTLEPSIIKKIDEDYILSIQQELQVINDFIDELLAEKTSFRVEDKVSESDYNDPELTD